MSSVRQRRTFTSEPARPENESKEREFQRLKAAIHEELVESFDLSRIGQIDENELLPEIVPLAEELCQRRAGALNSADRERMVDELIDELFGLGPLEGLMKDPTITDILVNNANEVYIERRGRLELTDVTFADDKHVLRIIQRIVGRVGRRIDEVSPMVDARLPDGSRVNAVVPPLAIKGPTVSIRRFGTKPLDLEDLIGNGSLPREFGTFLTAAVEARVSTLIAGGAGAGKTTLLNALSAHIPADERLITIEDSAELILQHKHVVSLETRVANTEGAGAVTPRDLVRNSLRMRPDRIIVGEVRGAEALDMLQALNTGHEGSMTTIHANDTREALARLEMMIGMAGFDFPVPVVRQYVAAGIKLVIQVARLKGGVRRVMRVSEIVGAEGGSYVVMDVFGFQQRGVDSDGVAYGDFYATGYRPQCLRSLAVGGLILPDELFAERFIAPQLAPVQATLARTVG
jgi:pilus assembly protein CpaF